MGPNPKLVCLSTLYILQSQVYTSSLVGGLSCDFQNLVEPGILKQNLKLPTLQAFILKNYSVS